MKRREFLKGLSGILAIPAICNAKILKGIRIFNTEFDFTILNFDNIKIDGTFDEWVESIRVETKRILTSVKKNDVVYSVKIKSYNWNDGKNLLPAKAIEIFNTRIDSDGDSVVVLPSITYFAFAKFEFERNKHSKKYLKNLINTRFISMVWSIENRREKDFKLLKRFDPKHKTPNDYLH